MKTLLSIATVLILTACGSVPVDEERTATTIRWYPLTLSVTVPDTAWSVEIREVVEGEAGLLVRAELLNGAGVGAQVISQAEVTFLVGVEPGARVRYYLEGKTWNWANTEPDMVFIEDRADFADEVDRTRAESVPWRVR